MIDYGVRIVNFKVIRRVRSLYFIPLKYPTFFDKQQYWTKNKMFRIENKDVYVPPPETSVLKRNIIKTPKRILPVLVNILLSLDYQKYHDCNLNSFMYSIYFI